MQKIMFNDKFGLTKAVLEGKKTQTRRFTQMQNYKKPFGVFCKGKLHINEVFRDGQISKYAIGEVVVIAQSYESIMNESVRTHVIPHWSFADEYVDNPGWNNKMFVKADLMPHQIRITDIRLERLQDISSEDCLKEGIKKSWWMGSSGKYLYGFGEHEDKWESPREAYAALIDRISGKGTWEKNPWVFVYDFECVKSPFF